MDLPSPSSQQGASLLEFAVAAVPILLLGTGAIELASWFQVRQIVSLALLEAGRAAIVDHARPQTMARAFEQALLPLFASASPQQAQARMQTQLRDRSAHTGIAPWQIEVIAPPAAAFEDFGDARLGMQSGLPHTAINNDYQEEQHAAFQARGWAEGRGPQSGLNIYQANTLVLRATWLHEPLLPGLRGLLRSLGGGGPGYGSHAMASGYLPLMRDIALPMQSHPVLWPSLADGTVRAQDAPPLPGVRAPETACRGLWCGPSGKAAESGNPTPPDRAGPWDSGPVPRSPEPGASLPPPWTEEPGPIGSGPGPGPDGPLCGVVLCCAGA